MNRLTVSNFGMRKERKRKRKTPRRPVNVLASVLTTFSLSCGIASIFATIGENYSKAAYLVLVAILFDILDGSVAKLTKSVSEFGKQLDSLCDLVSFGAAPAVLIYTAYVQEAQMAESVVGRLARFTAIVFVICAALRLARYTLHQSDQRDYFVGLPVPGAGATIASFVLFDRHLELNVALWLLGPITLALAALMVSTIRYPKDKIKKVVLAPRRAFRALLFFSVVIAALSAVSNHSLPLVFFPISVGYIFFGIGDEIFHRFRAETQAAQAQADQDMAPGRPLPSESPSSKTGDAL